MNRPESNGWAGGKAAEWEYECLLGNLSICKVIVMVVGVVVPFVLLSWICEAWLGIEWPQSILAIFVAVHLLPGYPTDLADKMRISTTARLRFWIPVWCARIALSFVIVRTYFAFMDKVGVSQWVFLAVMAFVAIPAMWNSLVNTRQYAMSSMVGLSPPSLLPVVMMVGFSQVGLWAIAANLCFGESSPSTSVAIGVLAVVWHLIGNFVLVGLVCRRVTRIVEQPLERRHMAPS
jgi:hypothetical protein